MRRGDRASIGAWLAFALLVGGCSAGSGVGAPSASDSSSGSSGLIARFFAGSSASSRQAVAGAQPDVNCPRVDIRMGASTLTIGPTGDKAALSLKYQGTFARVARECAVVDGNMVMKIGVQGRIIVGPAGGPGQVDVPLRLAVVQEAPGGTKPIVTKFIRIPVTIGPNEGYTTFTHIEEAMSFPLPTPTALLDDYIAYVGFDPLSAEAEDQQKQKPKPKPKARPKPAASAN